MNHTRPWYWRYIGRLGEVGGGMAQPLGSTEPCLGCQAIEQLIIKGQLSGNCNKCGAVWLGKEMAQRYLVNALTDDDRCFLGLKS